MSGKTGFTLIEIVMVIAIVGILAGVATPPILAVTEALILDRERNDLVGAGESAMRRMMVDIRRLQDKDGISEAEANLFEFTDVDGALVEFRLDVAQSAILLTRAGNEFILTYDATDLTFTYYNDVSAHTVLTAPVAAGDRDEIRTIRVSFTLDPAAGPAGEVTFQTEIRPRNLPHMEALFS